MSDISLPPQVAPGRYVEAIWGNAAVAAIQAAAPACTIKALVGIVVPNGHVALLGQTVAAFQSKYPTAWDQLPPSWKNPDGSATLPDATDMVLLGGSAVGSTGGSNSVTLSLGNMPPHGHTTPNHVHTGTTTGGSHAHFYAARNNANASGSTGEPMISNASGQGVVKATGSSAHSHTLSIPAGGAGTSGNAGSGVPIDVTPRHMRVVYIMRVY